jgi:hypothetical protein
MLAQDLHGHGALAGDHVRVVEGRYKGAPVVCDQVQRMGQANGKFCRATTLVRHGAHPAPSVPAWCGHDDRALIPSSRAASATPWAWFPADAVITPGFLLRAQLHQFVVGASDLEGKGRLQVFALEQDLVAQCDSAGAACNGVRTASS